MNENSILANDAHPTGSDGCDQMPCETAPTEREMASTEGALPEDAGDAACDGEEAVELSAASDQDSDPDLAPASETAAEDGLEQLRAELKELKQALGARDAFLSRLGAECEEFSELFPDAALSELPDDVWENVNRGVPLAAAYALTERRRVVREAMAAQSNRENRQRSAGAVVGIEVEYFSPSEVRKMSKNEVRTHYAKIISSMKKWN